MCVYIYIYYSAAGQLVPGCLDCLSLAGQNWLEPFEIQRVCCSTCCYGVNYVFIVVIVMCVRRLVVRLIIFRVRACPLSRDPFYRRLAEHSREPPSRRPAEKRVLSPSYVWYVSMNPVCVSTPIYIYIYICIYRERDINMCCVCIYIDMYTYTHMYTYVSVCISLSLYIYIYT